MPKATPTITTPAPGAVHGPTLPSIVDLGRLYVAADKEAIRADEDRARLPPFDEKRALGLLWERKDAIANLVMTLRPASVADVLVQLGMGVRQLWDLDHVERTQDDQMEALTRIRYAMSGALPVLARECGLDLAEVCEQDVVEVSTCAFPTVPEVAAALAGGDDALAVALAGSSRVQHPATAVAPPKADAELIALCDQLAATEAEITAMSRIQDAAAGPAEAAAAEKAISAIYERRKDLFERIGVPTSLAGARAMARAALATASRNADGEVVCDGDDEWLAFAAAEFLAGEAVA